MKSRLNIGHLIFIFLLGVLPLAATFALQYPDERHYTDGALMMLRDHDWLVPKTPVDNSLAWTPRFQKPPLAYWLTAASFSALGITPFAARLPFLLACAGTLLLTWRMARRLTGNAVTAQLAAVILLSQFQFILCAARSMPDALLVFSVTLSAFGFLRLIALGEITTGAYAMAYGGAALAAMSKGLLGLGIVLFAWAFVFTRERKFNAVKKLLHWPSLALATLLVGAWFAAILHRYGAAAWHGFFDDQVTGNLHGSLFAPLWRAPVFALLLLVNFLPWSLPAFETWWRGGKVFAANQLNAPTRGFILAWAAVLVMGFALGSNVSPRYLLPAAPLFAIFVADILASATDTGLFFSQRRLLKFALGLLLVLNFAAMLMQLQWPTPILALMAVGLFVGVVLVLGFGVMRWSWFAVNEGLGLAVLLIFPLLFFVGSPAALPDPCEQMAMSLQRLGVANKPVLFIGSPAKASGVRLFLGGKINLVHANKLDPQALKTFQVLLVPMREAASLRARGYGVQVAANIVRPPAASAWWSAFRTRTVAEMLEDSSEKYLLITAP